MLYAIIAVLVVIADQWVKYYVQGALPLDGAGVELIPGILSLTNVHNNGVSFGLLSSFDISKYIIILTAVFVVAVIVALATRFVSNRLARWSLVLMAAGGVSNCIDRIICGYVQDMFRLELFEFPVFNVADVFLTVFCLLFALAVIFGPRDRDDDEEEDEFEEEDDEEEDRPRREKKEKEPKPAKNTRRARQAKYEDEYEQYKAAKALRQQQEAEEAARRQQAPAPQPAPQPTPQARRVQAAETADPFAEWERANAAAGAQPRPAAAPPQPAPQQPAQPQQPAAAQPAAAPQKPAEEYSLDDILAEFK